ncbi:acyl-ACP desaturase [Amycolatopsis pigmentata]|uniref:Acyl-ACP desaturase n=1 Tax=Amycolatopsis pigmentata TaxID=450801 RepID=A0ABW5FLC3_9PSEU
MTSDAVRHVDPTLVAQLVGQTTDRARQQQWSIDDLDWAGLRPELLTDEDRSAVRFITMIEDHIPGYLAYFIQVFPVTGADLEIEDFCFNREYFRFLISWANDEDRHALVLTKYQIEAGVSTPEDLVVELATEGRKRFALPYERPIQAFTYTLIQEKATQLFYQLLKDAISEPVLGDLLNRLARDEARHFAFYNKLVSSYVERHGLASIVPDLKDVLETFRMPLADTLDNYWRWSLKIANQLSYDHTEAYESVARLVESFVKSRGEPSTEDLLSFIARIRAV